nr:hypothetical protein LMSGXRPZ_LMSGXRPZ_CDS_0008 [Microvirus sp.]
MSEMIRQFKHKVFPHAPYDMYSHFSPVYGFFVDNEQKSDTFGEILFGQIGERNDFEAVQSFKDDCDMTLIKKQLLKSASESDWDAVYIDYDEEVKQDNEEFKDEVSISPAKLSDKDSISSGTIDSESKEKVES